MFFYQHVITVTLRLVTLCGLSWCGACVTLSHDALMAYCGVAYHGHGVALRGVASPW